MISDTPRQTLEELKAKQAIDEIKLHEIATVQEAAESTSFDMTTKPTPTHQQLLPSRQISSCTLMRAKQRKVGCHLLL